MPEYTYKDVIIDPEDPRVEIGMEYYRADFPKRVLNIANNDEDYFGTLESIDTENPEAPFIVKTGSDYSSWACIIRKKEVSYAERQAKWIADNDVKKGDKVRVTRKADSYEDGWDNSWTQDMDKAVGNVYTVADIHEDDIVLGGAGYFGYPYFVLEKVEPEYVPYDFDNLACRASLLGKVVKSKKDELVGPALIIGFSQLDGGIWLANVGGIEAVNKVGLLHEWAFLDGTPCGKFEVVGE